MPMLPQPAADPSAAQAPSLYRRVSALARFRASALKRRLRKTSGAAQAAWQAERVDPDLTAKADAAIDYVMSGGSIGAVLENLAGGKIEVTDLDSLCDAITARLIDEGYNENLVDVVADPAENCVYVHLDERVKGKVSAIQGVLEQFGMTRFIADPLSNPQLGTYKFRIAYGPRTEQQVPLPDATPILPESGVTGWQIAEGGWHRHALPKQFDGNVILKAAKKVGFHSDPKDPMQLEGYGETIVVKPDCVEYLGAGTDEDKSTLEFLARLLAGDEIVETVTYVLPCDAGLDEATVAAIAGEKPTPFVGRRGRDSWRVESDPNLADFLKESDISFYTLEDNIEVKDKATLGEEGGLELHLSRAPASLREARTKCFALSTPAARRAFAETVVKEHAQSHDPQYVCALLFAESDTPDGDVTGPGPASPGELAPDEEKPYSQDNPNPDDSAKRTQVGQQSDLPVRTGDHQDPQSTAAGKEKRPGADLEDDGSPKKGDLDIEPEGTQPEPKNKLGEKPSYEGDDGTAGPKTEARIGDLCPRCQPGAKWDRCPECGGRGKFVDDGPGLAMCDCCGRGADVPVETPRSTPKTEGLLAQIGDQFIDTQARNQYRLTTLTPDTARLQEVSKPDNVIEITRRTFDRGLASNQYVKVNEALIAFTTKTAEKKIAEALGRSPVNIGDGRFLVECRSDEVAALQVKLKKRCAPTDVSVIGAEH